MEKTSLTIGALPVPDAAGVYVARARGYFKAEGIDKVNIVPIQAGPFSIPKLVNGSMDVALSNYPSTFIAQEKGGPGWVFLADAYDAAPKGFVLLTGKNSSIKKPADLAGKRIAIPAIPAIGMLAVTIAVAPSNVTPKQLTWVAMGFPQMEGALKQGKVDAIWATEPWISKVQADLGASTILDTMSGPTDGLPIAGWQATAKWAKKYPRTAAAFRRALLRAQVDLQDRRVLENILPSYTSINSTIASTIAVGRFPTSVNPIRIQRVADLMVNTKWCDKAGCRPYLAKPLDARTVLAGG